MYFLKDGEVHHATIISKVSDKMIFYSGNTVRRYNYALEKSFQDGAEGVYIVRLNDCFRGGGCND